MPDRPYNDPISRRIREELRRLRREKGWSIYDLSRAAEVSPSFISMMENGHKAPDPRTIERIAAALGMDPELARAWVTVRDRPRHPQEAIDAAYRLMDLLDEPADAAPQAPMAAEAPPLAWMAAAREEPVLYARTQPPPKAPPAERRGAFAIPVVREGTAPTRDEPGAEEPLRIDERMLPPRTDLRGAFAWKLTRAGVERVRGEYRPSDWVVIAPNAWEPDPAKLAPPRIFAVRIQGRGLLSRITWGGGQLILLPSEGGSDYLVRPAPDDAALRKRILGRVVMAVRRFAER